MTKKCKFNSHKAKSIFVLAICFMLCFVLFFCTACGDTDGDNSDKTYSKTENDTAIITNGSFEFGTYSLNLDDYPKTSSISGWSSVSADNSADSSKVSSGIIDTSSEAWEELINTLYKDSDFLNYAKHKYSINETEESAIKEQLKQKFLFPDTHENAKGSKVLMVNNYTKNYKNELGTAQKTTSSTTVTLEKGEFGKLSVWVKTDNLSYTEGERAGANVRLINTFNSSTQAQYAIYGITNTEWTNYVIYLKGDANYAATVKVVLGLGIGDGSNNTSDWTEGTAYFDDVVFEKIDETAYNAGIIGIASDNVSNMTYNSDNDIYKSVENGNVFAYDMTFKVPDHYFTAVNFNSSEIFGDYTLSNSGYTGNLGTDVSSADVVYGGQENLTVNVKKASYTLTTRNFTVESQKYLYITFKIENDLHRFDKNGITVYVYDTNGSENNVTNVLNFAEQGEEKVCGIMLKNNFKVGDKSFYIKIVIGPTDVTNRVHDDYATGSVTISDMKYAIGDNYQYTKDALGNPTDIETENYDYYSFYSSLADSTVALYAGNSEDYTDNSTTETFNLSPAPNNYGEIMNYPVSVNGYKGVGSDSYLIKNTNTNFTTDKRSGYGDNGSYAGLINTKYISNYNTNGLPAIIGDSLSGLYSTDKNLQPLMIYNNVADAYGYVGKTLTVSASSYAKISVDVKVIGSAKAYIYLVDAYGQEKQVLKLDDFVCNTDGYDYKENGKEQNNNEMFFVVDKNSVNGDWVTVSFYIATGATEKKFRLEMWNGGRDGSSETASQGLVYFNNISISTSSAFSEYGETEGNTWTNTFTDSSSVLYGINAETAVLHRRELDDTEKAYNKEYPDSAVSYNAKYVWVKGDNVIYAVFNTIDPVAVDPYEKEADDDTGSGCTAETDPSTFWLSFSSILLGAALVLAIIMLVIKNIVRRRKANANDAKSHYKVTSRVSYKKDTKKAEKEEISEDIFDDETADEIPAADVTINDETEEKNETLDDYVYGEVQDFGGSEDNKSDD